MKRQQVTCLCSAYSFPHRIGGGKCNGSDWASSYYLLVKSACRTCPCNYDGESSARRDGSCDVANELEDITHCNGYAELKRYDDGTRLPLKEDDYEYDYDRFEPE